METSERISYKRNMLLGTIADVTSILLVEIV